MANKVYKLKIYPNPEAKIFNIRAWNCPKCHTKHERDTNAGINILNKGLR